jgi:hypothetical protein
MEACPRGRRSGVRLSSEPARGLKSPDCILWGIAAFCDQGRQQLAMSQRRGVTTVARCRNNPLCIINAVSVDQRMSNAQKSLRIKVAAIERQACFIREKFGKTTVVENGLEPSLIEHR